MAEKNEKLMPRGLIPSSPEVLAAAKKYTVPERKGLPEVFLRWISCVRDCAPWDMPTFWSITGCGKIP